jgi:hypothetical protein
MEISLGKSLCGYLYLKLAKNVMFSFFSSVKLENSPGSAQVRGLTPWERGDGGERR